MRHVLRPRQALSPVDRTRALRVLCELRLDVRSRARPLAPRALRCSTRETPPI